MGYLIAQPVMVDVIPLGQDSWEAKAQTKGTGSYHQEIRYPPHDTLHPCRKDGVPGCEVDSANQKTDNDANENARSADAVEDGVQVGRVLYGESGSAFLT